MVLWYLWPGLTSQTSLVAWAEISELYADRVDMLKVVRGQRRSWLRLLAVIRGGHRHRRKVGTGWSQKTAVADAGKGRQQNSGGHDAE